MHIRELSAWRLSLDSPCRIMYGLYPYLLDDIVFVQLGETERTGDE